MSGKAICVFCGSSLGNDKAFETAAQSLGKALANSDTTLVYGAGTRGLMGATAKSCFLAGGRVHGIIPSAMVRREREGAVDMPSEISDPVDSSHDPNARSIITLTDSMHQRKKLMADLSCAFVCLPGGYGTLEELSEMTTWTQLNLHRKPVILLNVSNFYTGLADFVSKAVNAGFISKGNDSFLTVVNEPADGDWGRAALEAVKNWTSGGAAYDYEWADKQKT